MAVRLTDIEKNDAIAVATRELAAYVESRKVGILAALLQFYDSPVWCTPFHSLLSLASRRRIRFLLWAFKKKAEKWSDLACLLGFVAVELSPQVSVSQRGRSMSEGTTFCLRSSGAHVVYIRTALLQSESVYELFAGIDPTCQVRLLGNVPGMTEYDIYFKDTEQAVRAVAMRDSKILFAAFRSDFIATHLSTDLADLQMRAAPAAPREKVAPLVVDNLPFWTTQEQVVSAFSDYGTVVDVRFAINDLNGCHFGCCLVLMSTVAETEKVEAALDGKKLNGNIIVVGNLCKDNMIRSLKGMTPRSMGGDVTTMRMNFSGPMGSTLTSGPR
ncbi:hypothetical protein DIPPA_70162 [Diplonema papillatum]|nr:hypothetical protein DIPPA_70162 [Diplonema papillatum]